MSLPAKDYLGNANRTHGEMQSALDDQRDAIAQIPGAGVVAQSLTISSGDVTPALGSGSLLAISGEGGAADTLDTITATNIDSGQTVILYAASPGTQAITVNHAFGSGADINLVDATDFVLNAAGMYLCLRYNGTDWDEVWREWGDQTTTTSAYLTFHGLGDAATKTVGTATTNVPLVSDIHGKQTVYVPASAINGETTNGAAAGTYVQTAGRPEFPVLDFDGSSAEYAQFTIALPKSWDLNTVPITARFYFTVGASQTTETVKFGLALLAISSSDPIDTAFGTAGTTTKTLTSHATNDLVVTAYTGNITVSGTPADGDLIFGRIDRDPATDTCTYDARLIGLDLLYTTDALNDD